MAESQDTRTASTIPQSTFCPVAALADEARRLIDAHNAVDDAKSPENDLREKWRMEAREQVALDFLKGVLDRSTYLQPQSGKGALFQLCVVSELVQDLHSLVFAFAPGVDADEDPIESDEARKANCIKGKIERTLFSISEFIERMTGDTIADAGLRYFMNPNLSDHTKLSEALALAEAMRKDAA